MSKSPPRLRSKKDGGVDVEAIVEAVVARLQLAGLVGAAAAAAPSPAPSPAPAAPAPVWAVKMEGPDGDPSQLWLQELRRQ